MIIPKVIAIGGVAGTGKTRLMKKILSSKKDWVRAKPEYLLDSLYSKSLNSFVIGKYAPYYPFNNYADGSDRLSMGVQPMALKFFSALTTNCIFEGDRLFNSSVLEYLTKLKLNCQFYLLKSNQSTLEQRYKYRGSTQSEKFIKSRVTKYANIENNPNLRGKIMLLSNDTEKELDENVELILKRLVP